MRYPLNTALTVSAGLAQIGEFSFILAGLSLSLGLLSAEGHSLVVAGALISIALNPLMFSAIEPVQLWIRRRSALARALERAADPLAELPQSTDRKYLANQVVVVGYGRVGRHIAEALRDAGIPFVVADQNREIVERLRAQGQAAVLGNATEPLTLVQAHIAAARMLVIATPQTVEVRQMVETARKLNPDIEVAVRSHNEQEAVLLEREGAGKVFVGESELARSMTNFVIARIGESGIIQPTVGPSDKRHVRGDARIHKKKSQKRRSEGHISAICFIPTSFSSSAFGLVRAFSRRPLLAEVTSSRQLSSLRLYRRLFCLVPITAVAISVNILAAAACSAAIRFLSACSSAIFLASSFRLRCSSASCVERSASSRLRFSSASLLAAAALAAASAAFSATAFAAAAFAAAAFAAAAFAAAAFAASASAAVGSSLLGSSAAFSVGLAATGCAAGVLSGLRCASVAGGACTAAKVLACAAGRSCQRW